MPQVIPIKAFKDNYIWGIHAPGSRQLAVVDPGDAAPVEAFLAESGMTLSAILVTHHHWDHVNGIPRLLEIAPVPVYAPAREAPAGATVRVDEGQRVHLAEQGLLLDVLHIPGHTLGHVAYYGQGLLFCGDTLFAGGCGRLFEGSPAQMHDSLSRLASLPDETQIYCGHEYTKANLRFALQVEPDNQALVSRLEAVTAARARDQVTLPSSMAQERATNPFLRADQPGVIKSAEHQAGKRLSSPVDVFAALRAWKDTA